MKAQGASEFLAIFAVVLLLSMIVVSLIGSEAGSPQGSSESESRIYWSSTAKPLQVESGSLLVKNADPSSVMITAIEVEGTDAQFCEGNGREAESVDLAPYAKKFIGIITSDSLPCEEGRQASLSLRFSYAKDSIARVQNGTRELVVPCTVASPGQYLSTAPAK
jgi:hypothetical protein